MSSKSGGWPTGYGLQRLGEIDSTNAEAARLAASAREPLWIFADRQTAGRGRRGRPWSSPDGTLSASLLLFPAEPPEQAALRSFVAALALAEAFDALGVPRDAIALKWPNDVLLYDCKVAGILLESAGHSNRLVHLIIGTGINLNQPPDATLIEAEGTPPISLAQVLGHAVGADDMGLELARAYDRLETVFTAQGFAPIRAAWLERAARLGQPIRARTARDTWHGTFETIDEAGNLVLLTPTGRQVIPAADVFF